MMLHTLVLRKHSAKGPQSWAILINRGPQNNGFHGSTKIILARGIGQQALGLAGIEHQGIGQPAQVWLGSEQKGFKCENPGSHAYTEGAQNHGHPAGGKLLEGGPRGEMVGRCETPCSYPPLYPLL